MTIILTTVGKNPLEENSLKYSTWVHPQKWQNDLGSFWRQTIPHHSNPSLCLNHWEKWLKKLKNQWRNSSVLWRPTRPSRTNTKMTKIFRGFNKCYCFPANFFTCYKYLRQKWSHGLVGLDVIYVNIDVVYLSYRKSREVANGLNMVARFLHFIWTSTILTLDCEKLRMYTIIVEYPVRKYRDITEKPI